MIKHSWLSGDFRGRAGLCLLGIVMALAVAPAPALAVPHRARAHRVAAQTTGESGRASRPGSKSRKNSARKSKNATPPAKSAAKSKHHKRRRQVEADNDPITLHRAAARPGKLQQPVVPQRAVPAQQVVAMASAAPEPVTPAG